jgi:hypothetical protein
MTATPVYNTLGITELNNYKLENVIGKNYTRKYTRNECGFKAAAVLAQSSKLRMKIKFSQLNEWSKIKNLKIENYKF